MSSIAIREILESDHAQWLQLWAGYNAFYGRSGASALPTAVVETTWQRFFDPSEPVHALVAECRGQLVGLAHYLYHRSTIQIQPTCYMQDLYTAEQSRGLGVGRKLLQAVYDRALAAGAPRVYWQTHETNSTAIQLYDKVAERSGFIVYRKLL
ncbi:GNAT family N-acetyltransferase [Rhodanobacter ginsengisoli]|uniref:GNAT family N-acetyltransferase n=1 Tax=Rhodanobacter ginsengisoli TaxID=418646 RepID=A0ABW0QP29_9GAMM